MPSPRAGLHTHQQRSVDPTKTTTLRRRFMGEASRRFRQLITRIREQIIDEDGFGLSDPDPSVTPLVANRGRFEFERSDQKVDAFMRWLEDAQREEILTVREGTPVSRAGRAAWTNRYIETAYQRGVAQAGQRMRGQGVQVEESWVRGAFNRPIHADRAGLIYTRAYRELEGITDEMDRQISRTLAQGISEGRGPREIARSLTDQVKRVGITRARTLARSEVIAAHAEATLNSYEEAGVEGVEVESEFTTAQDSRVCPECESLEGRTFSLREARGVIPVHAACRCSWQPRVQNGSGITLNHYLRRAA